jgi:hypothetical protein
MNEIKVSVSRETSPNQQRCPLFRFNRRFIICCALCVATLRLAFAEIPQAQRPSVHAPIAPPLVTLVRSNLPPTIAEQTELSESAAWQLIERQRKKKTSNRREKFETEFGIDDKRLTGVLGSVQSAKYAVDQVTFTVDDFARNVSDGLKLEYDHGRVYRPASVNDNARATLQGTRSDLPKGVRFGPELTLDGGRPYVGLVVVVPLGN